MSYSPSLILEALNRADEIATQNPQLELYTDTCRLVILAEEILRLHPEFQGRQDMIEMVLEGASDYASVSEVEWDQYERAHSYGSMPSVPSAYQNLLTEEREVEKLLEETPLENVIDRGSLTSRLESIQLQLYAAGEVK